LRIRDSGFRIRDAQVEAGTEEFSLKERRAFFGEKQSHQVIENTRWRPRIGQNNPNFAQICGKKRLTATAKGKRGGVENKPNRINVLFINNMTPKWQKQTQRLYAE